MCNTKIYIAMMLTILTSTTLKPMQTFSLQQPLSYLSYPMGLLGSAVGAGAGWLLGKSMMQEPDFQPHTKFDNSGYVIPALVSLTGLVAGWKLLTMNNRTEVTLTSVDKTAKVTVPAAAAAVASVPLAASSKMAMPVVTVPVARATALTESIVTHGNITATQTRNGIIIYKGDIQVFACDSFGKLQKKKYLSADYIYSGDIAIFKL